MKIDCRQLLVAVSIPVVIAGAPVTLAQDDQPATGLVKTVMDVAGQYRDPAVAMDAGYTPLPSCVSGPEEGAMGVHLANPALIEDGMLDASQPELLVYEPRPNGRLRLIAVEYLVIAEAWDAANASPPVLEGQHFHYIGAPNRNGLPAFYELHVWAFKENPHGMFADWNPRVTCEHFAPSE